MSFLQPPRLTPLGQLLRSAAPAAVRTPGQLLDDKATRLEAWERDLEARERKLRGRQNDESDLPDDPDDNDNRDDEETDDNGRARKRNKNDKDNQDEEDGEDQETRAILSGRRQPGSTRSAAKAIIAAGKRARRPTGTSGPWFGPPQSVRRTPQTSEERQTLALRIVNAGRRARNLPPLARLEQENT